LPTKKKSAKKDEPAPEESSCDEATCRGERGMGLNFKEMMNKETQMHVFRGLSELALAMESMMPKSQMPAEVKQHAQAAKREVLLMLRSIIDAKLSAGPEAAESEPKLKKIDVE
jgi:hypothetical protein